MEKLSALASQKILKIQKRFASSHVSVFPQMSVLTSLASRISLNLFTLFFRSRDFIEIEMLRTTTAYVESVVV